MSRRSSVWPTLKLSQPVPQPQPNLPLTLPPEPQPQPCTLTLYPNQVIGVANEYLAKEHTAAAAYALATLSFFAGGRPSPLLTAPPSLHRHPRSTSALTPNPKPNPNPIPTPTPTLTLPLPLHPHPHPHPNP